MNKKKGKYDLVNDLFTNNIKNKLPVNFFLLRSLKSTDSELRISYISSSDFYNTDKMKVGIYSKFISNII
jgi:hypothetical protein